VNDALIATVIVIGGRDRVDEAADALDAVRDRGSVRRVLISEGTKTQASADEHETTIRLDALSPKYVDNAVAWLRLSSLPAVVWWRGGAPDVLDRLARLADRLVLDTDPPDAMWGRAPAVFDQTAITDLRWAALTRWRGALAHLFDLPQVRAGWPSIRLLEIAASDGASARLFAGWLRTSLEGTCTFDTRIDGTPADARTPLSRVRLSGEGLGMTLQVCAESVCIEASVDGARGSRMVPLGDGSLASRFLEEIGVRSRDAAFERALVAAMEMA
jgi:glucose-6-phosphate dehydrogenase assembly protein OpcA